MQRHIWAPFLATRIRGISDNSHHAFEPTVCHKSAATFCDLYFVLAVLIWRWPSAVTSACPGCSLWQSNSAHGHSTARCAVPPRPGGVGGGGAEALASENGSSPAAGAACADDSRSGERPADYPLGSPTDRAAAARQPACPPARALRRRRRAIGRPQRRASGGAQTGERRHTDEPLDAHRDGR